jgi:hypothetical protein
VLTLYIASVVVINGVLEAVFWVCLGQKQSHSQNLGTVNTITTPLQDKWV